MALAVAKAARLKPQIRLSQALSEYESILSADQKLQFSPPSPNAVMALTCDIDRQNAGRKTRRCGARLTSFLNSVKGFTSVVDLIVGSTGNPIAGAVSGTVKTAIQAASSFESYFDSLSTLLMNIGLTSPRIEKYSLLYPASISLQEELCKYYAAVVKLCSRIVWFVKKSVVKQIAAALRKPFDDEFGSLQKDLLRLGLSVREEVSLAAKEQQNIDFTEGAHERKESSIFRAKGAAFQRKTSKEMELAKKSREDKTKQRFLESCSTYNWETALNQERKKGASTWIFNCDEYQQWISTVSPSRLLCSGMVGSGKTVICANVIEDLTLKMPLGSSLAYFFCRSDEVMSLKAREILGSMARQLLEGLPSEIFACVQSDLGLRYITCSIERTLSYLQQLLPEKKLSILVVDGLDECEDEELDLIASSLLNLSRSTRHIFKLFWTGRPDLISRVSHYLDTDYQVHITPAKNGPEVSKFVESKLEAALQSNKLRLHDPNVILKIRDALEAGAHEMFLWVAFQIDSICALNTDHEILSSVSGLPKGLSAIFTRILRRLQQSFFTDPGLGKRIFEIVAVAQRPLTLSELREAISITPGDTEWNHNKLVTDITKCLESCGSFIVIDEEASTVHFAHSSIKRHLLLEPTDMDVRDYHIDVSKADGALGVIIVTYLNFEALKGQVTRTNGSLQPYAAKIPTAVLDSALSRHVKAKNLALTLLRGRGTPSYDPGPDMVANSNFVRVSESQMQQSFALLSYCQQFWANHTKTIGSKFEEHKKAHVFELWDKLASGSLATVEVPWAPEKLNEAGEKFLDWVTENPHAALARLAVQHICVSVSRGKDLTHNVMAMRFDKLLAMLPFPEKETSYLEFKVDAVLLVAAKGGLLELARLALRRGADVNAEDESGNALYHSVIRSSVPVAELLIREGADINRVSNGKYGSPLQAGATRGEFDPVFDLLIQKGANVNGKADHSWYGTALIAAAATAKLSFLRTLLIAGSYVNVRIAHSPAGYSTALEAALSVAYNQRGVQTLLTAGADVNALTRNGERVWLEAVKRGHDQEVEILLNYGVELDEKLFSVKALKEQLGTTKDIAQMLFDHFNGPAPGTLRQPTSQRATSNLVPSGIQLSSGSTLNLRKGGQVSPSSE